MVFVDMAYALGGLGKVTRGHFIERQKLVGDVSFPNLIGAEMCVGIYLRTLPRKPRSIEEARNYWDLGNRAANGGIKATFGFREAIDPFLVMVGYNPDILTAGVNPGVLGWQKRVAIYSVEEMPNPRERDVSSVFRFITRSLPKRGTYKNRQEQFRSTQILAKEVAPEVLEFIDRETKQHGMNRMDWFAMMTILDQAGKLR